MHRCVIHVLVVIKRRSCVITEVTYLEFSVLGFYLIYYYNDSRAKRDDYGAKPSFLSGAIVLAQVSAFIQGKAAMFLTWRSIDVGHTDGFCFWSI